MPSEIEVGDIVWLDPEANGHNPGANALWWLPGQERFQWVVTKIKTHYYNRKKRQRRLKYPQLIIEREDNGLPPFAARDIALPKPIWVDIRWLRKDEFLSAVKQAKTQHKKGDQNQCQIEPR